MHRRFIRLAAFLALCGVTALPATLFAQATGAWPRIITDDVGTVLTIARKPRTIVSVTLPTDEILLSLVSKERIAAVTAFSEDPAVSNVARLVTGIPVKLAQLNAEVIISLRPDIVFVADWSEATGVAQLRSAGIAVYQFKSPVTLKQIQARITAIGTAVGEEPASGKLIQWMDMRLAVVAGKLATITGDKKLSIMDYNTWGTSMGPGSSWYEIVRLAGLESSVAALAADRYGSVPISREMLLRLDPDILILPGWVNGDAEESDAFYQGIVKDPALRDLKAVKTGRVRRMSEALKGATSQYIVLGIEDLAKYAYPSLFE